MLNLAHAERERREREQHDRVNAFRPLVIDQDRADDEIQRDHRGEFRVERAEINRVRRIAQQWRKQAIRQRQRGRRALHQSIVKPIHTSRQTQNLEDPAGASKRVLAVNACGVRRNRGRRRPNHSVDQ